MYGVGGLDDVAFVGDMHGLAFLWVEVHEPVVSAIAVFRLVDNMLSSSFTVRQIVH